jgi:hypothetical protein
LNSIAALSSFLKNGQKAWFQVLQVDASFKIGNRATCYFNLVFKKFTEEFPSAFRQLQRVQFPLAQFLRPIGNQSTVSGSRNGVFGNSDFEGVRKSINLKKHILHVQISPRLGHNVIEPLFDMKE